MLIPIALVIFQGDISAHSLVCQSVDKICVENNFYTI